MGRSRDVPIVPLGDVCDPGGMYGDGRLVCDDITHDCRLP